MYQSEHFDDLTIEEQQQVISVYKMQNYCMTDSHCVAASPEQTAKWDEIGEEEISQDSAIPSKVPNAQRTEQPTTTNGDGSGWLVVVLILLIGLLAFGYWFYKKK